MADGLGTTFASIFNAMPNTSYSQNAGLVAFTGVISRHVGTVAGIILILLGLFPKLGGIIAAKSIIENIKNKKDLSIYEEKFKESWVYKELHAARNVKPSFSWGLILGIVFTGLDQILFRGKLPLTLKHKHADHEVLKSANQMQKINYPKPDGKIFLIKPVQFI